MAKDIEVKTEKVETTIEVIELDYEQLESALRGYFGETHGAQWENADIEADVSSGGMLRGVKLICKATVLTERG